MNVILLDTKSMSFAMSGEVYTTAQRSDRDPGSGQIPGVEADDGRRLLV